MPVALFGMYLGMTLVWVWYNRKRNQIPNAIYFYFFNLTKCFSETETEKSHPCYWGGSKNQDYKPTTKL